MDWKHGYFAESGYTYGYYSELAPARLAWLAKIKGYQTVDSGFRYLDLGCGQGFGLILLAAAHPESEFVGIDFMPEHIAHGRSLAKQAGVTNVQFIEGDFLTLAQSPERLGTFDYVVAHGITTWISSDVRAALFSLASDVLSPGGLMYNSYNTFPGWLPASPLQHLVAQLQTQYSGHDALGRAVSSLTALKEAGSSLFDLVPPLQARLEGMKRQDPAYLVQEYNNQFWQPVYCSQMLSIARGYKLQFLASATLPEAFDGCYPSSLLALINAETDPILRETIRDLGVAQSFRRDVYSKGGVQAWGETKLRQVRQQRFVATGLVDRPDVDKPFEFKGSAVTVSGARDFYTLLLEQIGQDGASLLDLEKATGQPLSVLVRSASLLLHGGWIGFDHAPPSGTARKLNQVIASAVLEGAPYRYLCLPRVQSATVHKAVDLMLLGLLLGGCDEASLPDALHVRMKDSGQNFWRDGIAIEDPQDELMNAKQAAKSFIDERLPLLRHLAAV